MPDVVALLPVYNDSRYLAGWLESVGEHVDAVVALDDGSTDESLEILTASRIVTRILQVDPVRKTEWNEPRNRHALVSAGQELSPEWFVAFDADERPEEALWAQWRSLVAAADAAGAAAISQPLREIWNSSDTYRVDGVWGRKRKAAIFRNLGERHLFDPALWHGEWYSAELLGSDAFLETDVNLYHLKMLHGEDRLARMRRYQQLDPEGEYQSIGYEYLADEANLQLETIPSHRAYTGMRVPHQPLPPDPA